MPHIVISWSARYLLDVRHDYPFDPSHGYTLATLLQVEPPEAPADFADFWTGTREQAGRVPTAMTRRKIESTEPGQDLYEIEFDALGGRCGGWLTVPELGTPTGLMVLGHGYGGRTEPGTFPQDRMIAVLSPCATGFHRSARPDVPAKAGEHVLHGIGHRDTYIHRFNVAEIWAAATALLELFPHAAGRLFYSGASFGGGLGALALPWDPRFTRASLEVPSLGHHPFRLKHPCTGAGAAVRHRHETVGDVLPVLRYFDAATSARFIRQPVLAVCALFDPSVPPAGQFAVYNAIPGEKRLRVATAGHFEYPELAADLREFSGIAGAWFAG